MPAVLAYIFSGNSRNHNPGFRDEEARLRNNKRLCLRPQSGRSRAGIRTQDQLPLSAAPGRRGEGTSEWAPWGKALFVGNPTRERCGRTGESPGLLSGCLPGRECQQQGQASCLRRAPGHLARPSSRQSRPTCRGCWPPGQLSQSSISSPSLYT